MAITEQTTKKSTSIVDHATNNIDHIVDVFRRSDDDLMDESTVNQQQQQQLGTTSDNTNSIDIPSNVSRTSKPFKFVPLRMNGRTHTVSRESQQLIRNEVSLQDLEKMTSLFYEKVFQDPVLDKFIRNQNDPHGERFAKWIHQKLSGSHVWDDDREQRDTTPVTLANNIQHVVHDRSSAHAAAWYSPKRPEEDVGRHFQLDECRVWMRLHFWALRESGILEISPSFADYYVRFIGHFVRVYEATAQVFARDSYRWSADPKNIDRYIQSGRRMNEIMKLSYKTAKLQIPISEANDTTWPYNKTESYKK